MNNTANTRRLPRGERVSIVARLLLDRRDLSARLREVLLGLVAIPSRESARGSRARLVEHVASLIRDLPAREASRVLTILRD